MLDLVVQRGFQSSTGSNLKATNIFLIGVCVLHHLRHLGCEVYAQVALRGERALVIAFLEFVGVQILLVVVDQLIVAILFAWLFRRALDKPWLLAVT